MTKRNDAHRYIGDLYSKGVRNFVIVMLLTGRPEADGRCQFPFGKRYLVCFAKLAAAHRKRFKIPVIGVAGSNGKTVVKEWLYQLLHEDYNMVRSPRSYNSQIGVPLSIWEIDENTELAVIEAGYLTRRNG
ncbi:MAG: Mur ligase family protein [Coprobacter fastidiosus]